MEKTLIEVKIFIQLKDIQVDFKKLQFDEKDFHLFENQIMSKAKYLQEIASTKLNFINKKGPKNFC